jgi:GTP cyclohydrolase I
MKDIQNLPDFRRINIQKVGVKNISYPLTVLDQEHTTQKTVATVNMYVNLPHHFKGTHMSRFIEILNRFRGEINLKNFHRILAEMKTRLQAEEAHLEIAFPYFLKKAQGTSPRIAEYRCAMHGSLGETDDLVLTVQVPIYPPSPSQTALGLPKSLGHWGLATVCVRLLHFIWLEDLIRMIESVTTHDLRWPAANDDSKSPAEALEVENITKSLGRCLQENAAIRWFSLTVKNYSEGCNTFASLEWSAEQGTDEQALTPQAAPA